MITVDLFIKDAISTFMLVIIVAISQHGSVAQFSFHIIFFGHALNCACHFQRIPPSLLVSMHRLHSSVRHLLNVH